MHGVMSPSLPKVLGHLIVPSREPASASLRSAKEAEMHKYLLGSIDQHSCLRNGIAGVSLIENLSAKRRVLEFVTLPSHSAKPLKRTAKLLTHRDIHHVVAALRSWAKSLSYCQDL